MVTSVNKIPKKQIVIQIYVTILPRITIVWSSPDIEEPHQIRVLTVDVTENFDWGIKFEHNRLIFDDVFCCLAELHDFLRWEDKFIVFWIVDKVFWLAELIQKLQRYVAFIF